jgi:peptidyl-prolyl cis-trans isomerase C
MSFPFAIRSADTRRRASASLGMLLLAGALLLLTGCGEGGASDSAEGAPYTIGEPLSDSTIVAVSQAGDVTDTLTSADFEREMNSLSRRLTRRPLARLPDSVRQRVQRYAVLSFLSRTAQTAEAQQRGLSPDSGAVAAELAKLRQRMGGDSTMQARLAQSGMSMKKLRANIQQQLLSRSLQEALSQEAPDPSAEEVQQYRREQAQQVRVEQILFGIPPGAGPGQRDSVQQRAQAVLDSIQSGEADFAQLAARYGRGEGSSLELEGYQTREQLGSQFARRGQNPADATFVQQAFALEDSGAVADEPVRTRYGYHLIRQTGRRTGALPDSAQAAQQLAQQQRSEYLNEQIRALLSEATIRLNPDRVTADMTQPLQQDTTDGGGGGAPASPS